MLMSFNAELTTDTVKCINKPPDRQPKPYAILASTLVNKIDFSLLVGLGIGLSWRRQ